MPALSLACIPTTESPEPWAGTGTFPGPPTVLVAEDDPLVALTLEELLQEAGFHVLLAADGLAALDCAAAHPFDILLTDLRMPRLDGAGLIRRLRSERPDLPVVILSGTLPASGTAALDVGPGPVALLRKPAAPSEVVGLLHRMVMAAAA